MDLDLDVQAQFSTCCSHHIPFCLCRNSAGLPRALEVSKSGVCVDASPDQRLGDPRAPGLGPTLVRAGSGSAAGRSGRTSGGSGAKLARGLRRPPVAKNSSLPSDFIGMPRECLLVPF